MIFANWQNDKSINFCPLQTTSCFPYQNRKFFIIFLGASVPNSNSRKCQLHPLRWCAESHPPWSPRVKVSENLDVGGFHLYLLVFPFVYQFYSRIEALVSSSFANDQFNRIPASFQYLFNFFLCHGCYMKMHIYSQTKNQHILQLFINSPAL